MLRQIWFAPAFALITGLLLPFQIVAVWAKSPAARRIPMLYHRCPSPLDRAEFVMEGEPSYRRPLLIVSNHVSWLDIVVPSSRVPVTFVAKREVAGWLILGRLARLQQTVFVDRENKLKSRMAAEEMAERMLAGHAVVLFAEGTSATARRFFPSARRSSARPRRQCLWTAARRRYSSRRSIEPAHRCVYGDMALPPTC